MKGRWLGFVIALVLSGAIWLVHNLSKNYTSVVDARILASSNIDGRARHAAATAVLSARCAASGFRLLSLGSAKHPSKVFFDPSDLEYAGGDSYRVGTAVLYKYVKQIFGENVSVESFLSDGLELKFAPEEFRKVPVVPVQQIGFRTQYMASEPVSLTPDSVIVYGDASLLAGVDAVYTRRIVASDLRSSIHATVKLEVPSQGLRLSQQEAEYRINVTRFVEISQTAQVVRRNVPSGKALSVFPPHVEVRYRCAFPVISDPSNSAEFYVDYEEFENSLGGRCLVHCDGLPDGVIDVTITPEVCECVEEQL